MKIVTFNCHGFKSSVQDIILLCEQFDVIILQELWLSSEDVSLLRSIHKAFEAYAVSAMNDQLGIQVGRPFGGIGVLWRKSISHACTICDLQIPFECKLKRHLCGQQNPSLFSCVYGKHTK